MDNAPLPYNPDYLKKKAAMDWNKDLKRWECDCGEIAPNWSPDDVKFPDRKKSKLEIILSRPISFVFCCVGFTLIVFSTIVLLGEILERL